MKPLALIVSLGALLFAQNPQPPATAKHGREPIDKIELLKKLEVQCPSCIDALDAALSNPQNGPLVGVVICCGISTVPQTSSGTQILYLTKPDQKQPPAKQITETR